MAIRITTNNYGGRITLSSRNLGGIVRSSTTITQYLLNFYPGAAAAYSLRLLSNSYTGSAVRVRRSSDSAEQNIGFISGELDTASLLSFCGAGNGFVTTWYDQSGNSKNATQTTVALQPQIVAFGVTQTQNGKPTIIQTNNFAQGLQYLETTYSFDLATNKLASIFNVGKANTITSGIYYTMRRFNMADYTSGLTMVATDGANLNRLQLGRGAGGSSLSDTRLLDFYTNPTNQSVQSTFISTSNVSIYRNTNNQSITNTVGTMLLSDWLSTGTGLHNIMLGSRQYTNSVTGVSDPTMLGNYQEYVFYLNNQSANLLGINTNINTYYRIYGWQGTGTALLDLYPGAAAAYSLRNLSSTYLGPLVRVRRSSDNTEQDIYGTAAGQIDSGSMVSFCGAGNGFVTTWYDQSGNSKNATQTTVALQPQIVTSGAIYTQGTKPSIFFNSHFLRFTGINVRSDIAYFVVHKKNGLVDGLSIGSSLDANIHMLEGASGYFGFTKPVGTTLYAASGVNGGNAYIYQILQGLSQSTTLSAYYNGTTISLGAPATSLTPIATVDSIGKYGSTLTTNSQGQEVIIYNTNQVANRVAIVANINSYYAVY